MYGGEKKVKQKEAEASAANPVDHMVDDWFSASRRAVARRRSCKSRRLPCTACRMRYRKRPRQPVVAREQRALVERELRFALVMGRKAPKLAR